MNLFFAALLIGAVYVSVRRSRTAENTKQLRRGEAYYLQVRKEMGIDPYSPAELAEMEAEERYTHDKNAASGAFWTGSHTWIDSNGNVREL